MQRKKGASGMFWGIIFVVIGIIVLLNVIFGLNLPIMRTVFGVILIYWGISIIFGSPWKIHKSYVAKTDQATVFNTNRIEPSSPDFQEGEYSVVFGEQTIDLTQVSAQPEPIKIEVNTVFGRSKIILPKNSSYKIDIHSVAASVTQPSPNVVVGDSTVYFEFEVNTVFGSTQLQYND